MKNFKIIILSQQLKLIKKAPIIRLERLKKSKIYDQI